MALKGTDKLTERKKRTLFIILGAILGVLVFNLNFLLDYLFYFDPELEKAILLLVSIGLGGFISGLIPLKIVDGLISNASYSVFFYIQMNLMAVFYYIQLGVLDEVWEPQILAVTLLYVLMTIGCSIIGIGLRFLIVLLFSKLRKSRINCFFPPYNKNCN